MMRRPDVFTLEYSHPLAQGLVFAGLGQLPGSSVYADASRYASVSRIEGISAAWGIAEALAGRHAVTARGSGGQITLPAGTDAITKPSLPVGIGGWFFVQHSAVTEELLANNATGTGYFGVTLSKVATSNVLTVRVGNNVGLTSSGRRSFNTTAPLPNSGWVHIFANIRTVNTNGFDVYINGSLQGGTYSGTATALVYSSANGHILSSQTVGIDHRVADPLIYNRALSPAEIALLADRTDPMLGGLIREERPVLYFDMHTGYYLRLRKNNDQNYKQIKLPLETTEYLQDQNIVNYDKCYARIAEVDLGNIVGEWSDEVMIQYVIQTEYFWNYDTKTSLHKEEHIEHSVKSEIQSTVKTELSCESDISSVFKNSLTDLFSSLSHNNKTAQSATSKILTNNVFTFDGLGKSSLVLYNYFESKSKLSVQDTTVFDTESILSNAFVYSVINDSLAKVSENKKTVDDSITKLSSYLIIDGDSISTIKQGIVVTINSNAVAKIGLQRLTTVDLLSKIAKSYFNQISVKSDTSSQIVLESDIRSNIAEGVSYSINGDCLAKVSRSVVLNSDCYSYISNTYYEIADALAKPSNSLLLVFDGRCVVIESEYETSMSVSFPTIVIDRKDFNSIIKVRHAMNSKTKAIFKIVGAK